MQNFEEAVKFREEEERFRKLFDDAKQDWKKKQEKNRPVITGEDISYVVSKITGIPLFRLEEEESEKLLHMEDYLHKRIVGQDEAISAICRSIRRSRAGLKDAKKPELININNKYYLAEVSSIEKVSRNLEDKEIRAAIIAQLKIKHIIENNTNIVKKMSEGKFNNEQFQKFSKDNKLEILKTSIKDIKNENIFTSGIIKEIFKMNDGEFQLITDSKLTKNYIILAVKTQKLLFNKNVKDYEQYKAKAKLNLANQIYSTFDETINTQYNVKINEKVLNRIKNTF